MLILKGSLKRGAGKLRRAYSIAPPPVMVYLLWTVVCASLSAGLKLLGPDKHWEELKVKHEWSDVPKGWVEVGRPPADHSLKINFGLRQEVSGVRTR